LELYVQCLKMAMDYLNRNTINHFVKTTDKNGEGLQWYNHDARPDDAQIGRWHHADLLAEQAPNWSPYRYCYSNPVNYTDPSGLKELPQEQQGIWAGWSNNGSYESWVSTGNWGGSGSGGASGLAGVGYGKGLDKGAGFGGGGGGWGGYGSFNNWLANTNPKEFVARFNAQSGKNGKNARISSDGSVGYYYNQWVTGSKEWKMVKTDQFEDNEYVYSVYSLKEVFVPTVHAQKVWIAQGNGGSFFGDILKGTEKHFNGSLGTIGVGVQGYNNIGNDVKRAYAYKLSKITGIKSGKIFQGAKGFTNSTGKLVSKLGPVGTLLGVGVIGYEVGTDTWDAHTIVNGSLMIGAGIATIFAAPAVLTGIALYGVGDYFFDFSGGIDNTIGRNSGVWKP
jgi:RHS repeat-associated protein